MLEPKDATEGGRWYLRDIQLRGRVMSFQSVKETLSDALKLDACSERIMRWWLEERALIAAHRIIIIFARLGQAASSWSECIHNKWLCRLGGCIGDMFGMLVGPLFRQEGKHFDCLIYTFLRSSSSFCHSNSSQNRARVVCAIQIRLFAIQVRPLVIKIRLFIQGWILVKK